MATFRIWYRADAHFATAYTTEASNVDPSHYRHLGEAEATDLGDLFRRMNCVDGSDVELVGRGRRFQARSMSVGDVVVDAEGHGHLCSVVGWETFDASTFAR
jgi:hypothetical protein